MKFKDYLKVNQKDSIFDSGKIRIITSYSPFGKYVEVKLNKGKYWETISKDDLRAHKAFIALHNSKR